MPERLMRPTAVYRLFGDCGLLLYVGVAYGPLGRVDTHLREQPWWGEVREGTIKWFPCRDEAEAAEREAIKAEQPLYNVMHSATRKKRSSPKPPEHLRLLSMMRSDAAEVLALCGDGDDNRRRVTKIMRRVEELAVRDDVDPDGRLSTFRDMHWAIGRILKSQAQNPLGQQAS